MEEILDYQEEDRVYYREYAGFWLRVAASLIDGLLVFFVISMIMGIIMNAFYSDLFTNLNNGESIEESQEAVEALMTFYGIYIGLQIIGGWLYHAFMESSKHQGTIGKVAVKIQVVNKDGERISFWQATGRHFGKIISTMIIYIGFIMVAFTEKKQGLHDMMASCLVVKKG